MCNLLSSHHHQPPQLTEISAEMDFVLQWTPLSSFCRDFALLCHWTWFCTVIIEYAGSDDEHFLYPSYYGVSQGLKTSVKVCGEKPRCKKMECKEKLLYYWEWWLQKSPSVPPDVHSGTESDQKKSPVQALELHRCWEYFSRLGKRTLNILNTLSKLQASVAQMS